MWGVSSLHTPRNARPQVAGALPPALPKQPGWRGQELCAPWPRGSAHKGAPWGPGGRCGRPPVQTEDAPFLLLEALSLESQCRLLLSVCLSLQPASPLGVGTVMLPSVCCGRLELSSPEAHPWPLGTTPLALKPATAPGQAHVGPRGREGTVAGQPGLGWVKWGPSPSSARVHVTVGEARLCWATTSLLTGTT